MIPLEKTSRMSSSSDGLAEFTPACVSLLWEREGGRSAKYAVRKRQFALQCGQKYATQFTELEFSGGLKGSGGWRGA